MKLFPGPTRPLGQPYLYLIDNFARKERHIKVDLFAAGEPERAKMAAKLPILASGFNFNYLEGPKHKDNASPWKKHNLPYKCNVNSCWTYLNLLLQVGKIKS